MVNKHLDRYRRCCVPTTADHNNLIRAVLVQLKTTKGLTSEILRHQISEYMANEVVFFYPIMKEYLQKLKIGYNAYIKLLYQGKIWADEFMLGAIGRMFNIRISVISAYYTDIWNVFHKSPLPDVIIVSNGSDFGSKYTPTHFTATKGVEPNWNCVGFELNIGELGLHAKECDAHSAAIDIFERTEKCQIAQKAGKLSEDIDGLCHDLNQLCIRRDDIFKEIEDMKINLDQYKRLRRYYIAKEEKKSRKHKAQPKGHASGPTPKQFPQPHCDKLLSDATSEMDKDFDVADYEQMERIHDLYEPARKRAACHTKNAQRTSSLPPLPSLEGVDHLITNISSEPMFTMTQQEVAKVLETPVPTIPLELNTEQLFSLQSTGPEETAPVPINPGTTPLLSQSADKSIHEIETPITIAAAQPTPTVHVNPTTTALLPKVIRKEC